MTTAVEAPWAAGDERRRVDLQRTMANSWARSAGEPGQSPDDYKRSLAEWRQHKANLDAMEKHREALRKKIDDAVSKHSAATGPLHAELADETISAERRVALRVQVNDHFAELEATTKPLTKLLDASEHELQVLRAYVGARQVIENAYVGADSESDERRRALEQAINLLEQFTMPYANNAADRAALDLNRAREKEEEKEPKYRLNLDEMERRARFTSAVVGILSSWRNLGHQEREQIRKQRIAELYAE
jgi:hypothetical protein